MTASAHGSRPGRINAHDHLAHELIFVVGGAARYTIGDAVYDLQENSLLMVGRLERHSIEITRTPYRRIFMLIDATYGRRSRAVLITDSEHIILSPIQPETIANRVGSDAEDTEEEEEDE